MTSDCVKTQDLSRFAINKKFSASAGWAQARFAHPPGGAGSDNRKLVGGGHGNKGYFLYHHGRLSGCFEYESPYVALGIDLVPALD
jgi:hypothetical protein